MKSYPGKFPLAALIGAGAAAVAASVCCVVPLVLVLSGISGAWIASLAVFDPWRSWLSIATLACLSIAFRMLYGPATRGGAEGACVAPHLLRRRRRALLVATLLIALLLLFPYCIDWFI